MREPITYAGPDPITIVLWILIAIGILILAALIRRGPLCTRCGQPVKHDDPVRVVVGRHVHWLCGTCRDRLRGTRASTVPGDWTPEMLARLEADLRKEEP